MEYNDDQRKAIDGLSDFLSSRRKGKFQILTGSAGTGKTSCMREVAKNLKAQQKKIAFTAPTNKATKVLRSNVDGAPCMTIYSLLGLQLQPSGEVKSIVQRGGGGGELPIAEYDAVAVDEGSMIPAPLLGYLQDAAEKYQIPIALLGDRYQLPPVGEASSPIWEMPLDYELSKVMRFENQILGFATKLRDYVDFPFKTLTIDSNHTETEGIWKVKAAKMLDSAKDRIEKFLTGEYKAIAWRNITVDAMNKELRSALPDRDFSLPFSKGDRVIARSPCLAKDGKTGMHTDDEATVQEVIIAKHPIHPQYECFIADLLTDEGEAASVWTVTPRSKPFLDAELLRLSNAARNNPRSWRAFWELKESFHDIALAYAITAHRSQGSTYTAAFVDYSDILQNKKRVEAAKCLYVAASRPAKQLVLGG